jgi:tRNASer (uridine44-2'-O)-methyltransferase
MGRIVLEFSFELIFRALGRKRVGSLEMASHNVEELIEGVRKRGQFKTRRPEGKSGDH